MPVQSLNRALFAKVRQGRPSTTKPYYDDKLTGYGLRPSGGLFVEYRPGAGGRAVPKKRHTFGSVAEYDADAARKEAKRLLHLIGTGHDPAAKRTADRSAATVEDMVAFYLDEHVRPKKKPRSAALYDFYFRKHLGPALGNRKAAEVRKADVQKLHRAIGKTHPPTAYRVVALLRAAYGHAIEEGLLDEDFRNPAQGVEPFTEQGRERFLTSEELNRLGAALDEAETVGLPWLCDEDGPKAKHLPKADKRRNNVSPFVTSAIRLLLFTGARLGEILNLRWDEVDFERGLLFLPDSKTGRKTVLLNAPALAVLASLKELPVIGPYVIAGDNPEAPRSSIQRPWRAILAHAGITGLRIHDLRHSYASFGVSGGLGLPVIGRLLGHRNVTTTARYSHLADDPIRRASDAIGATIAAALARKPSADVVPLPERRKGA